MFPRRCDDTDYWIDKIVHKMSQNDQPGPKKSFTVIVYLGFW